MMFGWLKRSPKKTLINRYYREYPACWGWGVMIRYDSVWATGYLHARSFPTQWEYTKGWFTTVTRVADDHLKLTNEELSKFYGQPE